MMEYRETKGGDGSTNIEWEPKHPGDEGVCLFSVPIESLIEGWEMLTCVRDRIALGINTRKGAMLTNEGTLKKMNDILR